MYDTFVNTHMELFVKIGIVKIDKQKLTRNSIFRAFGEKNPRQMGLDGLFPAFIEQRVRNIGLIDLFERASFI